MGVSSSTATEMRNNPHSMLKIRSMPFTRTAKGDAQVNNSACIALTITAIKISALLPAPLRPIIGTKRYRALRIK